MSTHIAVIPPAEDLDSEAPYAESFTIDEGGIDLKIDGDLIISAAFEGISPFQLAYEVLPESFTIDNPDDREPYEMMVEECSKETGVPSDMTDEDLELGARAFLTALARRKGYEKK